MPLFVELNFLSSRLPPTIKLWKLRTGNSVRTSKMRNKTIQKANRALKQKRRLSGWLQVFEKESVILGALLRERARYKMHPTRNRPSPPGPPHLPPFFSAKKRKGLWRHGTERDRGERGKKNWVSGMAVITSIYNCQTRLSFSQAAHLPLLFSPSLSALPSLPTYFSRGPLSLFIPRYRGGGREGEGYKRCSCKSL